MAKSEFGWEIKYLKSRGGWYIVGEDGEVAPATCSDVLLWKILEAVRRGDKAARSPRRAPHRVTGRFQSR